MSSSISLNTIPRVLLQRELGHDWSSTGGYKKSTSRAKIESWTEADLLHHCSADYASFIPAPRSTIALCYNCNGTLLASTHGDHTVKITSCQSGKLSRVLSGHSRTPWVVRFHPRHPSLLASGSLDHEVRLWDASTGQCISRYTFGKPIASLAFHASVNVLAIACGHKLYMWEYAKAGSLPVIVLKTRRSMRAVHFHPHGEPFVLTAEVQDPSPTPELPATLTEENPSYVVVENNSTSTSGNGDDVDMVVDDDDTTTTTNTTTTNIMRVHATPSIINNNTHTNTNTNTNTNHPSVLLSSRHHDVPRSIVDVGREVPFPLSSFELQASATLASATNDTMNSDDGSNTNSNINNTNNNQQQQQPIPPLLIDINAQLASLASVWNILGDQADQPPRVKIRLWKYDDSNPSAEFDAISGVVCTVSDAVLCSEMGVHFSPCGRSIAATVACRAPMPSIPAHHAIIPSSSPGDTTTTNNNNTTTMSAPMEWSPPLVDVQQQHDGERNINTTNSNTPESGGGLPERVVFEVRILSIIENGMNTTTSTNTNNNKHTTIDHINTTPSSISSQASQSHAMTIQNNTLCAKRIRAAQCLTSVQFSPTGDHILLAYGKKHNSLLRSLIVERGSLVPLHTILEIVRVSDMKVVGVLPSCEDEINAACFHPMPGTAIAYGTKEGRLRTLSRNSNNTGGNGGEHNYQ